MANKAAAYSVAVMLLVSSLSPTSALVMTGQPAPLPPPSAALGVAGGLAVGIIATAALLCIYDVWLKFNGYKNWDGSPKIVKVTHHHHG